MGKKSGRKSGSNAGAGAGEPTITATAFVLKVPTHCRCDGCGDKIRAAVKDLTLRCEGILSLDQSALATKGELAVVATADPEKLCRRLRKATGKDVRLVFPKPPAKADAAAAVADAKEAAAAAVADAKEAAAAAAAASVQALLAGMHLQQPVHALHGQPMNAAGSWNALQHGGYGQPAYAYPWVLQQQQQQVVAPPSEPYVASYPAAAYPAASWGAYPHDGLGGAYGGGGGGWLGF